MKYILFPLVAFVTVALASLVEIVFVSVGFAAAIELATLKSNGDAIAAEPTIMNLLLVKFEFGSVIIMPPLMV
jgi:hypothetical protein